MATGCPVPPSEAPTPEPALRFSLPVADGGLISGVVGVDHDPEVHDDEGALGRARCTNFAGDGFPACYDEHDGSDFILEGGFRALDDGSVGVLAAAAGRVVEVVDEHYDRCHADAEAPSGVTCDGNPMIANKIEIDHVDPASGEAVRTRYFHLMRDSALVEVGDVVGCGDAIGLVGSSGRSSMPHLHFEVNGSAGTDDVIDPYAGPESQPTSWWSVQNDRFGLPASCDRD